MSQHFHIRCGRTIGFLAAAMALMVAAPAGLLAQGQDQPAPKPEATGQSKPNVLVIFGDDIGIANLSVYSDGVMGYETPNIDRIGKEGIRFLHYYGEQSCTAGRSAFLTGQHIIRTGLSKVGFPGAPMGMSQLDPSIGGIMKNLGYATGQFGKNHVGDRNESLPTVNGFDEFFGNLYHLNAEEEPELPDYPKDPEYLKKFGPRGVLHSWATDTDDQTVDPRFGKVGKRRSRTLARSPRSAWRPSTTKPPHAPSTSSSDRTQLASRSSAGGTARACTCAPTCVPSIVASISTATASTSTA